MNENKAQMLLKGLKVQSGLYQNLLEVMKRELQVLCSEKDQNSMISLLQEKLDIMRLLDEEDSQIGDIKNRWKESIDQNAPERVEIETVLKDMENLLKEILDCEERSRQYLESVKADFQDISTRSNAMRASQAYGNSNPKK